MTRRVDREEAIRYFADLFGGEHHIPHGRRPGSEGVKPYGSGWQVIHRGDLATWDMNRLTRAVFLAHDRCLRLEVSSAGFGLRLVIYGRVPTSAAGDLPIMLGHPSLEEAVSAWREWWPIETPAPEEAPHA